MDMARAPDVAVSLRLDEMVDLAPALRSAHIFNRKGDNQTT